MSSTKKSQQQGNRVAPRESDPLLLSSTSNNNSRLGGGILRSRRSPVLPRHTVVAAATNSHFTTTTTKMSLAAGAGSDDDLGNDSATTETNTSAVVLGYQSIEDQSHHENEDGGQDDEHRSLQRYPSEAASSSASSSSSRQPLQRQPPVSLPSALQQHQPQHSFPSKLLTQQPQRGGGGGMDEEAPAPLLEIPEEIYAVRKAALQVLKPLNKTWVVISVGFALTVLFGMARWTRLLPRIPFWFIVLPCWSAHVGLLWLHVLSAKALSAFIAEANESRQRPDSRDHLNRTEYLPLLQRSLKFGLKTGLLSFCVFMFEVLVYIRVARGTISLATAFTPLWLLVIASIVDGLICKTQHVLRVVCWILTFLAMVMTVMKVDYGFDALRWRVVISPVVTVLSIVSCSLIYIVYGHQIGYYRLTESQLTAGNLYSLAALICIVLIVMIGEVIPLSRPVEIETRLFVVILAPLVVSLVGMGAWVVSRDEFGRFLLYGGQSAVHPMKLKWEAGGWTSVQGKGVTVIPMFGEVSFQPMEKKPIEHAVEMLNCCTTCYPNEEDDEETKHLSSTVDDYHPYLDPSSQHQRSTYNIRHGA